jgi:hypothetical protein
VQIYLQNSGLPVDYSIHLQQNICGDLGGHLVNVVVSRAFSLRFQLWCLQATARLCLGFTPVSFEITEIDSWVGGLASFNVLRDSMSAGVDIS